MTGRRRRALLDWIARGPFAIAASTLQGGMNYAIVLYLSFGAGLAATGEYRTLFSVYGLLALTAMLETNKVYIRSVVTGDTGAAAALFANKLIFSLGGGVLVAVGWAVGRASGLIDNPDPWLPAVALIAGLAYPFDLYVAQLQAERRFRVLFALESVKYLGALAVFVLAHRMGASVGAALTLQLAFMTLCTMTFFSLFARRLTRPLQGLITWRRSLGSRPAREARTLSVANLLPASLEHVDKLLVGWVFGLTFLGVYTLAYSTGRFLYNVLKPAMYVYYRRFVDTMPAWPLLRRVGLAFTVLGVTLAAAFLAAIERSPAMTEFREGRWTAAILFCGYGVGIVHAAYSQAFALNKDTQARHALTGNVLATLGSLVLLGAALVSPQPLALILLALQYPFRDAVSVLIMERLRKRGAIAA